MMRDDGKECFGQEILYFRQGPEILLALNQLCGV